MYTLYILRCNDGSLYTGIAFDVQKRLAKHRTGKGSKYVRAHLPFKLVYTENHQTLSLALKREAAIKNFSKQKKESLIKK